MRFTSMRLATLSVGFAAAVSTVLAPAATAAPAPDDAQTQIVGGGFVSSAKPWISALHRNGGFTCTSSIIARRWVLTAAHCVTAAGTYTVRVGSLTRSSGGQTATVARKVIHPSYSWPSADIALLQLDRDVVVSQYSVLASAADLADNKAAQVLGWGSEKADWSGPLPERLKYADGRISSVDCAQSNATPRAICTQTNGSIAGGDSGGPVTVRNAAGNTVQAGVCAIGHRPAGSGWAGYTNVTLFRNWIHTTSGV
ncbi:serine protease [Allokutzneria sp. A3M-2-11 16]|uniref:S1 family peptidase n=1 Tax=Allokutzneria sp. A3M-2-11 16 TaxID=2962043 RepID=UPI0020B7E997|nr:serine protease [Allokutzneria sp. A3M-2-11 16]MCP3797829.1 serine protease [Allokutzneria sp. A3M-2-11 16]